jgi:DNA-binding GntR family transcriptional regulator
MQVRHRLSPILPPRAALCSPPVGACGQNCHLLWQMQMPASSALQPLPAEELRSIAGRAHARIRDAIVEGRLKPGERISERGLATLLEVSPMPVREALRRLEAEGMVETRPRSGTYVADLGPRRLAEIGLARAALEGVAAGLAAQRAGEGDIAAMRGALAAIRAATRAGDAESVLAANEALHAAIHAAAASADVARLLAGLRAYEHLGRPRVLATAAERRAALGEHAAIVAAIEAGDAPAAEAAMRGHAIRSLRVAIPGAAAILDNRRNTP